MAAQQQSLRTTALWQWGGKTTTTEGQCGKSGDTTAQQASQKAQLLGTCHTAWPEGMSHQ